MRALKIFVIVAGIAIVAGTAFLIFEILRRGMATGDIVADAMVGSSTVAIPPGTTAQQMIQFGESLALLVGDQDGRQWLVIVDPVTGRTIAELRLLPADEPALSSP